MIRIPLGGRNLGEKWALVDEEDYERVVIYRWFLNPGGYVVRNDLDKEAGVNRRPTLHRMIMGLERGDGLSVDHINQDPLDNRRSNLRVLTHAQNLQNQGSRKGSSSKYRGVSLNKATGRWSAQFMVAGKVTFVGYFDTELEAHKAVSAARAAAMPYTREDAA